MRTRSDLAERNRASATHGMSRTSTYAVWRSMRQRCENQRRKDFPSYGARGVKVCSRWNVFENFLSDMGVRPPGMTLERRNLSGPYAPYNCCWATPTEQARNRRSNVLVTHAGSTATVAEWAERTGLERKTLEYRIRAGWSPERAMTTPSTINRKASNV